LKRRSLNSKDGCAYLISLEIIVLLLIFMLCTDSLTQNKKKKKKKTERTGIGMKVDSAAMWKARIL